MNQHDKHIIGNILSNIATVTGAYDISKASVCFYYCYLYMVSYSLTTVKSFPNKVSKQNRNQTKSPIQQNVGKKPLASE